MVAILVEATLLKVRRLGLGGGGKSAGTRKHGTNAGLLIISPYGVLAPHVYIMDMSLSGKLRTLR